MRQYDVCAIGELLIDFTTTGAGDGGKPVYTGNPGGAPPNVTAAVAKLGGTATFMTRVGDDTFGRYLVETLRSLSIDVSGMVMDKKHNTTLAFVHNGKDGDRSFSFYRDNCADAVLSSEDISEEVIRNSAVLQLGTVEMSTPSGRAATLRALELAKENGTCVSFDPNLRMNLWPDQTMVKPCVKEVLPYTDYLKISEEEGAFLTGHEDPAAAAKKLMEEYGNIRLVMITLGDKGCYYRTASFEGNIPSIFVSAVDTTGCGDAFTGGVLFMLTHCGKDVENLSKGELEDCISIGCAMGALVATRYGAILSMPSMEELKTFIKEHGEK